jgi:hypothetical protein
MTARRLNGQRYAGIPHLPYRTGWQVACSRANLTFDDDAAAVAHAPLLIVGRQSRFGRERAYSASYFGPIKSTRAARSSFLQCPHGQDAR